MNPEAMKTAMEMMKNMPPDQVQKMMNNMNVTPEMMAQAQQMASRMSPDDWKRAQEAMKGMSPDEMQQQAAQAQQHFSAQTTYNLNASNQLKAEGNALHSAAKYSEAIDKYERAKANVAGMTAAGAAELRRACTLNLSSCYLNLKQWGQCVEQCNEVLKDEPDSLKALYRRGQAYIGQAAWQQATEDLARAVKLCPASDPAQLKLIREKLQDAKDQLSVQRMAAARRGDAEAAPEAHASEPAAASAAPPSESAAPSKPEDAKPASAAASASASATTTVTAQGQQQLTGAAFAAASPSAGGAPGGMNPEMLKATADMMRTNPDWHKQMDDMMSKMSDSEMEAMARSMGVPSATLTKESLASARSALSTMTPEQLEGMARMQTAVPPDLAARMRANPQDPEALQASVKMMRDNPDMVKMAADMMSKMNPEQLADMVKQTGMPAGASFTPELAQAAAKSFSAMTPEEMARMADMAASMRAGEGTGAAPAATTAAAPAQPSTTITSAPTAASAAPAPSTAGGASEAAEGGATLAPAPGAGLGGMMPPGGMTPEMAKMAADMMRSMPPEQLAAMTSAMGGAGSGMPGGMSPDMIKMAADMMATMKPEDIARMTSMMGGMGGAGGPAPGGSMGGMGGMGGMPSLDQLTTDTAMMESAMKMMRSMDPAAMADMLVSSGMVKDRAQAEHMAKQMSGMSDTHMKLLMKATGAIQVGAKAVRKAKQFLASRTALVIGIIILVVAILLRWFGIM